MTDKELAWELLRKLFDLDTEEEEIAAVTALLARVRSDVRLAEAKFFYDALKEDGTLLSFYLAELFLKRIADLEQIVKP